MENADRLEIVHFLLINCTYKLRANPVIPDAAARKWPGWKGWPTEERKFRNQLGKQGYFKSIDLP